MKKPDLQSGGCDRSGFSVCTPTGLGAYRQGHYLAAKKAGLQPGFAFFRTSPISSGLCPIPLNYRRASPEPSSATCKPFLQANNQLKQDAIASRQLPRAHRVSTSMGVTAKAR